MMKINIAKDFSRYPSGRFMKNGDTSGEAFKEKHLLPPLLAGESVTVELDGTIGYGSSFLEEAFGGVARKLKLTSQVLFEKITLVSSDKLLIEEIKQYIRDASKAS